VLIALLADTAATLTRDLHDDARVHPLSTAGVLVLALAVIGPGATFRPQLFTIVLLAAEGALLARGDRRLRAASPDRRAIGWELGAQPILLAVWANLHGGFVVGVAMLGLYGGVVLIRGLAARAAAPPATAVR
jgi:hypothetical protein